jgi:hypothetical protein
LIEINFVFYTTSYTTSLLLTLPLALSLTLLSTTSHTTLPRCVLHATILNSRAEAYGDMLEGDVIAEMTTHNPQLVKVTDIPSPFTLSSLSVALSFLLLLTDLLLHFSYSIYI